ncbi:folate-binding protein YgfZ [Alphaproteobacteria bacterium LSUCC0684]
MAEPSRCFLPERGLISIRGPEAAEFLHDLVTADICGLPEGMVRPAALLTPQGRILHDLLISRDDGGFLIECDTNGRGDLLRRFKLFRLRRKLDLEETDLPVHASINGAGLKDERFAQDVFRLYGDPALPADGDTDDWKRFRWRHGVPEGGRDLPSEKALPLEARLDLNNGISFEKGCYVGQEVTARTRYRGLVKRSYVPVHADRMIDAPADIEVEGKQAGLLLDTVRDGEGCLGLASLRLEYLREESRVYLSGGVAITPFFPDRLLPLPGDTTADERG